MREALARRQKRFLQFLGGFVIAAWALLTIALPTAGVLMPLLFALAISGMLWWVVVIAWIAVPAVGAVVSVMRLRARRYRSAALWSLVPAMGVVLVLYGVDIGDAIHFWFYKGRYDRIVSDVVAGRCSAEDRRAWGATLIDYECRSPVIVIFEHDGMLSSWRGIVYDASDEIAKPRDQRSAAWENRDIAAFIGCSEASVALGGHYYAVSGDFGSCP